MANPLKRIEAILRGACERSEGGLGLLETVIAVAIMGTIATVFITSLTVSTTSLVVVNERSGAESLARSQMEYVANRPYSADAWAYTVTTGSRSSSSRPSWWDAENPPLLPPVYLGFAVTAAAEDFDYDGDMLLDTGIRKITVTVLTSPEGRQLLTLEAHKVNR